MVANYTYDHKLSFMIQKHTLLMTKHHKISDFEMPKFHDFSLERMKDVISVIDTIVLKQLRPSGMLSGPSEPAPRASRLQTTAQNALRRDSGHFSAYLDIGRAATVAQTVDSQSTVCAEQAR